MQCALVYEIRSSKSQFVAVHTATARAIKTYTHEYYVGTWCEKQKRKRNEKKKIEVNNTFGTEFFKQKKRKKHKSTASYYYLIFFVFPRCT